MTKRDLRFIWVIEFSEDNGRTWIASECSFGKKKDALICAGNDNANAAYLERYRVIKYVPDSRRAKEGR